MALLRAAWPEAPLPDVQHRPVARARSARESEARIAKSRPPDLTADLQLDLAPGPEGRRGPRDRRLPYRNVRRRGVHRGRVVAARVSPGLASRVRAQAELDCLTPFPERGILVLFCRRLSRRKRRHAQRMGRATPMGVAGDHRCETVQRNRAAESVAKRLEARRRVPNGAESTSDASELTIELESRGMTRRAGGTLPRVRVPCGDFTFPSRSQARDVMGLSWEGLALSGCTGRSGLDHRRTTWSRAAGGFERIAVEISSDTLTDMLTDRAPPQRRVRRQIKSSCGRAPPVGEFCLSNMVSNQTGLTPTIYKYIHTCACGACTHINKPCHHIRSRSHGALKTN